LLAVAPVGDNPRSASIQSTRIDADAESIRGGIVKTLQGGFWGAIVVTCCLAVWGVCSAGPVGALAMLWCFGTFAIPMGFVVGSLVGFVVSLFPERVAARTVSRDDRWDEDDDWSVVEELARGADSRRLPPARLKAKSTPGTSA
jgi:uncharacterized membrane protein